MCLCEVCLLHYSRLRYTSYTFVKMSLLVLDLLSQPDQLARQVGLLLLICRPLGFVPCSFLSLTLLALSRRGRLLRGDCSDGICHWQFQKYLLASAGLFLSTHFFFLMALLVGVSLEEEKSR